MDFRRHVTAGRLSEIFGPDTLETDKFIRTMDWRGVAEQEWALLQPATREALTAYAEGVNAYLDERSGSELATEYAVLGLTGLDYTPAEWEPVDSLAWLKAMAWDLRGNMDAEVDRVQLSVDHTPDEIASLWPDYPYDEHPPIVSGGGVVDGVFEQNATANGTRNPRRPAYPPGVVDALERVQDTVAAMPDMLGSGRGIGSNSWVVDGEHSATGMPLLANDPHLGISQPGIWMQMGLHCREITPECTLDTSGLHLLRRARRGHRPQRRHRLGLHQPRPRRHRPLPRADRGRRPLRPRRRDRRDGGPHRDDQGAGRGRRRAARARDRPRTADQRRVVGVRHGRRQRADRRARRPRQRVRRRAGVDRARPGAHRRRDPRAQPRVELGRVPRCRLRLRRARAEPRVRRPRGPHRLPVAGTDPDPPLGQRRHDAGRGLDQRQRLDGRLHPLRRPAQRARPGGGLHRHRQPGGHRRGLPLPPDEGLGLRLPLDPHPRGAGRRGRAVGAGDVAPAARLDEPDGRDAGALPARHRGPAQPLLPQRPGPAARLGLHLTGRQRAGGVLQRRLAQPARADLPRRPAPAVVARRRRPVVPGRRPPAARARRTVVGRRRPPRTRSRPATTSCARR